MFSWKNWRMAAERRAYVCFLISSIFFIPIALIYVENIGSFGFAITIHPIVLLFYILARFLVPASFLLGAFLITVHFIDRKNRKSLGKDLVARGYRFLLLCVLIFGAASWSSNYDLSRLGLFFVPAIFLWTLCVLCAAALGLYGLVLVIAQPKAARQPD